jgi:threonine dehydrogenase-like Zn-dependent dehydrogenase
LILGAGTVGLLWNQLLRRSLSVLLMQSELVRSRLLQAGSFGADRLISPQTEDLAGAVREVCPEGVEYLIDTTGSTAAIQQALPTLKRGGTLMCFGICPKDEKLALSLNWFYQQQLTVLSSRRPPREMTRAIGLLDRGIVKAEGIVTGHYRLEQIEQALELFENGKEREIKMAIDPWKRPSD